MYYYRYYYKARVMTRDYVGFLVIGKGWPWHITPVEGDVLEVAHPSFCRWVCIYGQAD
jgi:hypothetical protein